MKYDRRGVMLGVALVVTGVAGTIGMAMLQRSVRSLRTGAWSREHLVLRTYADSVAEELHLLVQEGANTPGSAVFEALRTVSRDAGAIEVTVPAPENALGERRALEAQLEGRVTVTHTVHLRKPVGVSTDALERCGLVRYEVGATLAGGSRTVVERVRREHTFRVARVTPPRPLDQLGLFVEEATGPLFRHEEQGAPVFAAATGGATLFDICRNKELQVVPDAARADVQRAIASLSPEALQRRAHYVTASGAELARLVDDRLRRDLPVNGLLHNNSRDELTVSFPRFRGKCLISTCGSLRVGDIRLDDPARDSLTLVAMDRIVVFGRQVDAALASFGDSAEGVTFERAARVRGAVLTHAFPRGARISGLELAHTAIEYRPQLDSGDGVSTNPDARLRARYVAAFSPHPASVEHLRDGGTWSAW